MLQPFPDRPGGASWQAGVRYNRLRTSPLPELSSGKERPMQVRKQITVFLENKPGRLARTLSALAEAKINVIALSVMDRSEHSVLRLVAEDEAATVKVLDGLN